MTEGEVDLTTAEEVEDSAEPTEPTPAPKRGGGRKKKEEVDPKKPTRPPTAFMAFSNSRRATLLNEKPELKAKVKQIASVLGAEWNNLPEAEQQKFKDEYARKSAEFKAQIEKYYKENPAAKEKDLAKKTEKRGKKREPVVKLKPPKKPMNAQTIFTQERLAKLREDNPKVKIGDIKKKTTEEWKKLSDEEKAKYNELAEKDQLRYREECKKQQIEPSAKRPRKAAEKGAPKGRRKKAPPPEEEEEEEVNNEADENENGEGEGDQGDDVDDEDGDGDEDEADENEEEEKSP